MWRDIGYRQRGMGLLALIFWALVSVFVFMVALKILPVYKENTAINKLYQLWPVTLFYRMEKNGK